MKMNYLLKNNSKPRGRNRRMKIGAIALGLAAIFLVSLTGSFKGFVNKIALPFWKFDGYEDLKFSSPN